MNFPVFELNVSRVNEGEVLFPQNIESDDWVIYHGTSGFNSAAIENQGFGTAAVAVNEGSMRRVVEIYKRMKWDGISGGGLGVLEPFSLGHDITAEGKRITFFAERSRRALLYASLDFAGGEKLRAMRVALSELDTYLNDASLRQYHADQMSSQYEDLETLNACAETLDAVRPVEVDLEWLRNELVELRLEHEVAFNAAERHREGVVYAIKMLPQDVAELVYNGFMGIETTATIPASRIIAKVIVPRDFRPINKGLTATDIERLNKGLIKELKEKQ